MRRHAVGIALVAAVAMLPWCPRPVAADMDKATRIRLLKSVVYLESLERSGGRLRGVTRGSGTIISTSGHILTNDHVIFNEKTGRLHDAVAVSLTTSFVKKPTRVCMAYPRKARRVKRLDLAVIRCDADLYGRPLRKRITWRPMKVGRSATVVPGDNLSIIGYPGVGGMTITFTAGKVSGFQPQSGYGPQAWIKTDAQISPGVSGGAAVDGKGQLVGVPTQIRFRALGRTDTRIGMVRSIDMARSLIRPIVGSGPAPAPPAPPPATPASGYTRITGKVVDASSGKAVRGAKVLIIKPGVSVHDVRNATLKLYLHSRGTTNSRGAFKVSRKLGRGATYGVVISAKGYKVKRAEGGIKLGAGAPATLDVGKVKLRRKGKKKKKARRRRGGCGCSY